MKLLISQEKYELAVKIARINHMGESVSGINGAEIEDYRVIDKVNDSLQGMEAEAKRSGRTMGTPTAWSLIQQLLYMSEKEAYKWGVPHAARDIHRAMTALTTISIDRFTPDQRDIIDERFMSVIFINPEVNLNPIQVKLLQSMGKRIGAEIDPNQTTYSFKPQSK